MKKPVALILCLILCFSVSACGGNKTNNEVSESKPALGAQSSVLKESSSKISSAVSSDISSEVSSDISSEVSLENSSAASSQSSSEVSSKATSEATLSAPESSFQPEKMDPSFDPTNEEECYKIDFNSWQMYLANPWRPVPDNWIAMQNGDPSLAKVNQQYRPNPAVNSQLYFDARAIDYLHAMIRAAEADGVNLDVISAWRSNDFQVGNFQRQVDSVKANNPGISDEDAIARAATVVAKPGTSEHQLGLAVDFNSVEDSFRYTRAYAWLTENCTDYGFILRYEASKQAKTGIIAEPWHYRYVGVKNAKLIAASGLCMEEFIEKYSAKK